MNSSISKPRLVVVGNGMAGIRTVEELLNLCLTDKCTISALSDSNNGVTY